jgi:hypothetical protein
MTAKGPRCQLWIFTVAVTAGFVATIVWMRIANQSGDTVEPSFRKIDLALTRSLALAPEHDGLSALVSGFDGANATRVTVQPCLAQGTDACVLDAPPGQKFGFKVEIEKPGAGAAPRFFPVIKVGSLPAADACAIGLEPGDAYPPAFTLRVKTPGTCAGVDTTVTAPAGAEPAGWKLTVTSGTALLGTAAQGSQPAAKAATKELVLGCPEGQAQDGVCRVTIAAAGSANDSAERALEVTYDLKQAGRAVLLRNEQESLAGAVHSLEGELGGREGGSRFWFCAGKPGGHLKIDGPALNVRKLVVGYELDANLLAAVGVDAAASCDWAKGDFLVRFFPMVFGVATLLELLPLCRRRRDDEDDDESAGEREAGRAEPEGKPPS